MDWIWVLKGGIYTAAQDKCHSDIWKTVWQLSTPTSFLNVISLPCAWKGLTGSLWLIKSLQRHKYKKSDRRKKYTLTSCLLGMFVAISNLLKQQLIENSNERVVSIYTQTDKNLMFNWLINNTLRLNTTIPHGSFHCVSHILVNAFWRLWRENTQDPENTNTQINVFR